MARDGCEEVRAVERVEDDVGSRRHGRGSWNVSHEGNLSEGVARAESRQRARPVYDVELPLGDDVEAIAGVALPNDDGARLSSKRHEPSSNVLERHSGKRRKDRRRGKQAETPVVGRRGGGVDGHERTREEDDQHGKHRADDDECRVESQRVDEERCNHRADSDRDEPEHRDHTEHPGEDVVCDGPLYEREGRDVDERVPDAE